MEAAERGRSTELTSRYEANGILAAASDAIVLDLIREGGNRTGEAIVGRLSLCGLRLRGLLRLLPDRYQCGLAEYQVAPAHSLVKRPDNLPFKAAARFGYIGTMYSALRKAEAGLAKTILIKGISGTLSIAAVLLAPAMRLTRVYGTGRDKDLLEQVSKLAGGWLHPHSLNDSLLDDWIREETRAGERVPVKW
ncbi:hypothetical protein [Streptomyces griseoruber]|uniref:hypothetical protein n=1 Tax=Streptomyces griseoruber TaxID=1943 RepID=UPI0037AB02C9